MQKLCTLCIINKDITEFRKGRGYKSGIKSYCKECEAEMLRSWRKRHPEKLKAQWIRRNQKERDLRIGSYDPDKKDILAMQKRNAYLKRTYGISLDEYIALREKQRGRCAICEQEPVWTIGGKIGNQGKHPELVVDHCHKTGKIRALLCNSCNVAIANTRENTRTLERMIEYLKADK